jgi:glycosyltransferase involved in cell wall biosynthesis
MESKQFVSVVLTTWQREWMTELAIRALRRNTRVPIKLIIIDNGSDRERQHWYQETADIYVKLDHNYGLEHAKWLGMQFVESDLFVSMDNDILVYHYDGDDWLTRIIKLMHQHPEYGAIAPRPQILVGTGNIFEGREEEIVPFGHVPGYARVMRTQWVNAVGAWGDKRPSRGHEELWIGSKFAEKGIKMGWATQVRCWHLFGKEETDGWGYKKGMRPDEHGHGEVSHLPSNDLEEIRKGVGIDL